MKKKFGLIALTLFIIAALFFSFFTPHPWTKKQMEEDVRQHLYKEQGVTDKDILKLEVRFSNLKNSGKDRYITIVYFKDEPKRDYGYQWGKEGKIVPAYSVYGNHNPGHFKK